MAPPTASEAPIGSNRYGYRPRGFDTRVGEIELAIPKLRQGTYFPSFLEAHTRGEQALVAVVQEAYVNGVLTRKVDRPVAQLGLAGMSKSTVSRLCQGLDEQVRAFRERPLEGRHPNLWLDAKLERVREPGGVRHKCLVIAYGVHESGRREVIGLDVGELETEAFWREFLRGLRSHGLTGVRLCVSDAHSGLKSAIAAVLGCPWQRCTVHFLRDMLGHCARAQQPMIATAIRQVFNAASGAEARERLGEVAERLADHAPKVAELLLGAEEDLLGFYALPKEHWSKLRSTNPLERVDREIGRRSDVVGIFPNDASLIRLAGALLIEKCDEWPVSRRYLSVESLALVLEHEGDRSKEVRSWRRPEQPSPSPTISCTTPWDLTLPRAVGRDARVQAASRGEPMGGPPPGGRNSVTRTPSCAFQVAMASPLSETARSGV